jgi:dTDP-4-amino-4,6-dideoxygalactose transaminase
LFGCAGVISFNGNKILTTGGGGMIITNDSRLAKRAKHLSTTAKSDGLRFVHDEVGYNFRLVNLLAALGCSQLEKLPSRIEQKRSIFNQYISEFKESPLKVYSEEETCRSNYWLVNVVFPDNKKREAALKACLDNNIGVRPLWQPMHLQTAFKTDGKEGTYPHAEDMWQRTLTLPSSPHLTQEQISFIAQVINKAVV